MRDRHLLKTIAVVSGLGFLAIVTLVIAGGSVGDRRLGNPAGFWGPVLSSVDWCEENYQSTHYVAEFHNTITGLAIVLAGVTALSNGVRNSLEWRYILQGCLLTLVGVGTMAFHGTMGRGMQAADEVPMVWLVFVGAWSVLESTTIKGSRLPAWTPGALVAFLTAITLPNILTEGRLAAAVFHLSFAPVMLLYLVLCLCEMLASENADCKLLHRMGVLFFAFAFVCWQCDIVACAALQNLPFGIPNPQLHAWGWHLCCGLSTYFMTTANSIARCDALHRPCRVRWTRFGLPYTVPRDATMSPPSLATESSMAMSPSVQQFLRFMIPIYPKKFAENGLAFTGDTPGYSRSLCPVNDPGTERSLETEFDGALQCCASRIHRRRLERERSTASDAQPEQLKSLLPRELN